MPRPCEVKGCEASCLSRRVTHRLPSKEPYRTLWLQAIGRTEEGLSKTASICSDHFEPSSYAVKCNRGARLKYDAVPTLFLTEAETVQRAAELNSRQIAPSTNKLRPLAMKPSELSFRPSTTNKLRPLAMRPTGAPNAVVPAELVPITLVPSVAVRVVRAIPANLLVLPAAPANPERLQKQPIPCLTRPVPRATKRVPRIKDHFEMMKKKIGWKLKLNRKSEYSHITSSKTEYPEEARHDPPGAVPTLTTALNENQSSAYEMNMAEKEMECPTIETNRVQITPCIETHATVTRPTKGQEHSKNESSPKALPVSSKHKKGGRSKTRKRRADFMDDSASDTNLDDDRSEDDLPSPSSKWITKNDCFLARCLGKSKACKSDYDWIQKQFAEIQEETSRLKNSTSIRDHRSVH
ncbi:unnamed protein product [Ixodes persulcatus]